MFHMWDMPVGMGWWYFEEGSSLLLSGELRD